MDGASTKVNIQRTSKELIDHDENNIDGKSIVKPDSICFKTNEHNNNRSKNLDIQKKNVSV